MSWRVAKFILYPGAFLILVIVLAACGYTFWFHKNWRNVLVIENRIQPAEAIILLGGETNARPLEAARLYHLGIAPKIFILGTGDNEMNKEVLLEAGVPQSSIGGESKSESTYQNAVFAGPLLKKANIHNAVIVTSSFHMRRALATFQQKLPDIRFSVANARIAWWDTPEGSPQEDTYASIELIKIPAYWIFHGIHPWIEKSGGSSTITPTN